MKRWRGIRGGWLAQALLLAAPGYGQSLPEAPTAQNATAVTMAERHWYGAVNPGERVAPMSVREKLLYPAHQEAQWTSLVPIVFSGTYGVLRNSDPKVGTDASGFGERLGEAALRQVIAREVSESLLPIALHEDPRYYRREAGGTVGRSEYAVSRIFVTRKDSGAETFNYSAVLGRGIGAALTQTYYPEASIRTGVALRGWGYSLAALGFGDLYQEFLPDIRRKLFHRSN